VGMSSGVGLRVEGLIAVQQNTSSRGCAQV